MDRRIFGLENEYGIAYVTHGHARVPVDELAEMLFETRFRIVHGSLDAFLRNGARFYIDHGAHPEYATGECDSIPQLVAHDKAGERFVERLAIDTEDRLRAEGRPGDLYVLKNNTDHDGHTYGSHENYLVGREQEFATLTAALVPFLVTRQLLAGAGTVLATPQGPVYCFSQRAEHMEHDVGGATTHDRAMISTKDEVLATKTRFRRLHLIVGDSNMSETTTLLKVGSTDLVLRMVEDGAPLPQVRLSAPVRALKTINRDLTGTVPVLLADGRRTSALALQRDYLGHVREWAAGRGLLQSDPVVARVVKLWGATLDAVGRQDFSAIERDVDWAIKLRMIENYRDRHGLPLDAARVVQMDLAYHDVRRSRGLYYRMLARGMVNRLVADADVLRALACPPQTTRAKLRGDFVRSADRAGVAVTTDWGHFAIDGPGERAAVCQDPFASRDPAVAALIRGM